MNKITVFIFFAVLVVIAVPNPFIPWWAQIIATATLLISNDQLLKRS
jgi:apolipoprotein N-acyltransferase